MNIDVSKILEKACEYKTVKQRADYLKSNESFALKSILQLNFDENLKPALPEGSPPFKRVDPAQSDYHAGYIHTEARKLGFLIPNPEQNINNMKRENIFITILETVSGPEADMIIAAKDKVLEKLYKGITADVVRQAFPDILPLVRQRTTADNSFEKDILSSKSPKDTFTWIHKNNFWGCHETVSGIGSTLEYTKSIRLELPSIFNHFSIKKVFDGGCGDFNWMQHVLQNTDVEYIGADIVKQLIVDNNKKYKNDKTSFINVDLTKDPIPKVDLMICRDCIFHLSYSDTMAVLNNFLASGTTYLLATTHKSPAGPENNLIVDNRDIISGDYRLIDLFAPPYNFPPSALAFIEDNNSENDAEVILGLWTRDQILEAMSKQVS